MKNDDSDSDNIKVWSNDLENEEGCRPKHEGWFYTNMCTCEKGGKLLWSKVQVLDPRVQITTLMVVELQMEIAMTLVSRQRVQENIGNHVKM